MMYVLLAAMGTQINSEQCDISDAMLSTGKPKINKVLSSIKELTV